MKLKATVRKRVIPMLVAICLFIIPNLVMAQNPGDNPDAQPQAVPLSPGMTVILIGMGIILAMKIIKKRTAQLKPQTVNIN